MCVAQLAFVNRLKYLYSLQITSKGLIKINRDITELVIGL